ncbi:uncharacterized protein QC763_200495 [Podospora pseudopauciseta]|uniref:Uncharacterized protein n=2 Tax=Podospora TaxID=5144 RepID=A0ABR0HM29_9PEZI|nr:hypothetical protein QC763_200495 [Podospora pseudopauciseta]KAK4679017.1 hypothetical protein QC764_200495 [Podospora pseudoanserina]
MEIVDSSSHLPSHFRYHISVVPGYSLSPIIRIPNGPGEKKNGRKLSRSQLPWPEIQSTSLNVFPE